MNNESQLVRHGNQWIINIKFIWKNPPRVHTERVELGDCSEADAREAYKAVTKMIEESF